MDKAVQDITDEILKNIRKDLAIKKSFTLYYHEVFQELEISFTQDLPRSCPAINSIYLTEQWQNKGVLSYLVDRLLDLEWVGGVVIQAISNPILGMTLLHNPKWVPIINANQFNRLNRIIPLTRDNKEYYDFFLEIFENKRPVYSKLDISLLRDMYLEATNRDKTRVAHLTDDQLCGFAPEHTGISLIKIPDEHYVNYKNQIKKLAKPKGVSAHHYVGMSKFFDSFITSKPLRN